MATRKEAFEDEEFDDREFVLQMIDAMLRRDSLPDTLRDRILALRRDVSRMESPARI